MVRWPGSCPRWSGWPCARSACGTCRRTSGSRSLTCGTRAWVSGRSPISWAGRRRRSRVSCAATPQPAATGRSRLTAARPRAGSAAAGGGSRPAASCGSWSPSSWPSGGARSRSAASCGCDSPASQRCGCATRASTRPSTNRDHRCSGRRRWHRTIGLRCAPGAITARASARRAAPAPVRAAHAHDRPAAFPA